MTPLHEMTCREYAETAHPGWGEFQKRDEFILYLHAQSRLRVSVEQHSEPGFGLDRSDAIDDAYETHKMTSAERDTQEFVKDFVAQVGEHLSLNQLKALVKELEEELQLRQASRVPSPPAT